MGRKSSIINLTAEERDFLETQTRARTIQAQTVNRARILLETTDLSVLEIAERLAFNTPNYFIQCFRDLEGTSPAKYRKKLAEKAGGRQ